MRVLICGSRDWIDREAIRSWLSKLQDWGYDTVVEGEAKGADSIARDEAKAMGFKVIPFVAQWGEYHKAAGVIRNQQMLDEGKPSLVLFFHYNLQQSKGTKDMVDRARRAGIQVIDGQSTSSKQQQQRTSST